MIFVRLVAHFFMEEKMEKRVALIGIVVEQYESAEKLNRILHEYGEYVIGRMGIPYREKNMNIISVAVDAPMDVISTLSGKLGMLPGVSSKTIYAKSKKESL
jgi:putative iron-only hydrogenase system regulator